MLCVSMAPKFSFRAGNKTRNCVLKCLRCTATCLNGQRCKRRMCVGLDVCWHHLAKNYNLRIMPSDIDAGMDGLFCWNPDNPGEIVFGPTRTARYKPDAAGAYPNPRRNIIEYKGEILTLDQLNHHYGDRQAPYAALINNQIVDAACQRYVGGLANGSGNGVPNNARFSGRFIKATNNIRHGNEIIISYHAGYWNRGHGVEHSTKPRSKRKKMH